MEELHRTFHPGATIKHNDRIWGQNSEGWRQIDVSIRQNVGINQLLFIVDCKKRSRKVDINGMSEFRALKEDVAAHLGIMVSEKGYAKRALLLAKKWGIQALTFRDTKTQSWARDIVIPIGLMMEVLIPLRVTYQPHGGEERDENDLNIMDSNSGGGFTVAELFKEQLSGQLKAGAWTIQYPANDLNGNPIGILRLSFKVAIDRYISNVGLNYLGVIDNTAGVAHLHEFELPPIGLQNIGKAWRKLPDNDEFPAGMFCTVIRGVRNGKLENGEVKADFPDADLKLKFDVQPGKQPLKINLVSSARTSNRG